MHLYLQRVSMEGKHYLPYIVFIIRMEKLYSFLIQQHFLSDGAESQLASVTVAGLTC